MSDLIYAVRRKRRRSKGRFSLLLLLAGSVLIAGGCLTFYRHFMPIVTRLAEAEANYMVSAIVNNAVAARLAEGEMAYNDIISLEKDENGSVKAIMTNTAKVNLLRAEITADVINAFAGGVDTEINIPVGNLTGIKLLSGKGPDIPIELVTAAKTDTQFINHFSSAGINQTCHRIIVRVSAGINMMIPGNTVYTEIYSEVPVAETVIIGDVPESYTFFEADENWDENLERFDITS